jgi:mono/diheme cytochrome c family protein
MNSERSTEEDSMGRRLAWIVATAALLSAPAAAETPIERGKYLVTIAGCSDCHTPGSFLGNPDMTRFLGGSDVGFAIPDVGVFVGPNLTPDKETGIGAWTDEQIAATITTGLRPDGRALAPIMPWQAFSQLTANDKQGIAYLRSIPPVKHAVPGPFGPNDEPSVLVFAIVPGEVYAEMANPPAPK